MPPAAGRSSACVKATNAVGSAQQCFVVEVGAGSAPRFVSSPSTNTFRGGPFTFSWTPTAADTGTHPLELTVELTGRGKPSVT